MGTMVSPYAFAAGYVETGTFGYSGTFNDSYVMDVNEHGCTLITVPVGGAYIKTAHFQVSSTTVGNKVKPVLWNCANGTSIQSTDTLLKVGQEFSFPSTLSGANVEYSTNWNADGSAYFLASGVYGLGYHSNPATTLKSTNPGTGSGYWSGDTYSDGTAATFGIVSTTSKKIGLWSPYSITGP